MTLTMRRGDELPAWSETVTIDGEAPDFSAGWTFTVTLSMRGQDDISDAGVALGQTEGRIQVQWAVGGLDIAVGTWRVALVGKRTSDDREFTVRERLWIGPR